MNVEEVNQVSLSLPEDIVWGYTAYYKFVDRHPEYRIHEGDVLIFAVGLFPLDLTQWWGTCGRVNIQYGPHRNFRYSS